MFRYYNANPRGRNVDDCTVRAISFASGRTWDETYEDLCRFAQIQAIMPNDVTYIDDYLDMKYKQVYDFKMDKKITVERFLMEHPYGTYLITMNGHITCAKDGIIYDTFDPSDRTVWGAYKVEGRF